MNFRQGLLLILLGAFAGLSPDQKVPAAAPTVQQILHDLPECSVLRERLVSRRAEDRIDELYMDLMRSEGVKRSIFEVEAVLHEGKPRDPQITREAYFSKYDGADSQITDSHRLNEIESSEMKRVAHRIVLERASGAGFLRCVDNCPAPRDGQRGYALVELFDSGSFQEIRPVFILTKLPESTLDRASSVGDQIEVGHMLATTSFSTSQLNDALMWAAASRYDNSAVIEKLLHAGANINAPGANGTTPLISALASPCNVKALLDRGADPKRQDRWGHTALQIAKSSGRVKSEHLLEEGSRRNR